MSQSSSSIRLVSRIAAATLALLTLLLSFAIVSPELHEWLHADGNICEEHCHTPHGEEPDSDENDHVCAVTILDQGATALMIVELPAQIDAAIAIVTIEAVSIWCGQAPLRMSARAPPAVSFV